MFWGYAPGSGSGFERLEPLRLRRSFRLRTSKKFSALHSPASPPDVRQGYALPEANKNILGLCPWLGLSP